MACVYKCPTGPSAHTLLVVPGPNAELNGRARDWAANALGVKGEGTLACPRIDGGVESLAAQDSVSAPATSRSHHRRRVFAQVPDAGQAGSAGVPSFCEPPVPFRGLSKVGEIRLPFCACVRTRLCVHPVCVVMV